VTLVVSVRPHPKFERRGKTLVTDVDVPVTTAVLGGEAPVSTLTGKVMLKIPGLSQNGQQFKLSGLGMPGLKDSKRGDLLARLRVQLPKKLGDKERELFEQLKALGGQEIKGQGSGARGED
jgi:DnaJ-class molecular chaperone